MFLGNKLFNLSCQNNTVIYLQKVKNSNMISQLNQWKLCPGYPQPVCMTTAVTGNANPVILLHLLILAKIQAKVSI